MNGLERALKHLDKLIEHGLLDVMAKEIEENELLEIEASVVYPHVGRYSYLQPSEEEAESVYADAFKYAVLRVSARLWPLKLPDTRR